MQELRLLIVEDNEEIASLIGQVAQESGFTVSIVNDLRQFPENYARLNPHVIALDIVMPYMDGFEVLNYLHERRSKSRIIILSGQDAYRPMAERMGDGLKLEILGTLAKPFRIPMLRHTFDEIREACMNSAINVDSVA